MFLSDQKQSKTDTQKTWDIIPIGLIGPWYNYYLNKCFEPPNFHYQ